MKLVVSFPQCSRDCSEQPLSCVGALEARLLTTADGGGERELGRRCVTPLPSNLRTACDLRNADFALELFADVKAPVRGAVVELALDRQLPGLDACGDFKPLEVGAARSAPFDIDGKDKQVALDFPRCVSCAGPELRCDAGTTCGPLMPCADGGMPLLKLGECCPSC